MSNKITNHAAYLTKAKAHPLEVLEAPLTALEPNAIRVRVHGLAINPIDHILQAQGTSLAFPWLKYPLVLGIDVAGTVVEIGTSVKNFNVGDRVLGECMGTDKVHVDSQSAEAGFQEYSVLREHMSSMIPDTLSFEQACVLPLGLGTAACGLFQKDHLGMELPKPGEVVPKDRTVLIWGGSTSVGTCAIQLAVASGYNVITTCSPKNFEYCRALGAKHCFDYKSTTVVQDVVGALRGKVCIGALAVGANSPLVCMNILSKHDFKSTKNEGTHPARKFVSVVSGPDLVPPTERLATLRTISRFVAFGVSLLYKSWRHSIQWKFVLGTEPARNEVGPAIYNDFLPAALKSGQFRALPEAMVVGHGLEKVQEAMDVLKAGVSAKKVVVTLV
ncbi:hypothetical protein H2200_009954 [Cladophialophora chaetospira]|uniref:Enoyl reductase (ER) domain-containing protein n=1 Tax=Cladophialophora chaetospira TaxID=386627 RepID=A0AA38X263_9EURO|nr:hypothetical protein H2200_009954 [Cladophialophora chaetospira]